jgi:acetaldehyde dehydrogenase
MKPTRIKAAIIGSGNIGSDLMIKLLRHGEAIELVAMVGIDAASDGLARAKRLGLATTHQGLDGLLALPEFADIKIVFDATSAGAHVGTQPRTATARRAGDRPHPGGHRPLRGAGGQSGSTSGCANINMVTCGGQATIPMVAAVNSVTPVLYGEIVASIASKSAGPGTRANIDEFTETTSQAIVSVGGARQGKAIIILNPAEPPLMMRDTVFCLTGPADRAAIAAAVEQMAAKVKAYVPGYRLKQAVQFEDIPAADAAAYPGLGGRRAQGVHLHRSGRGRPLSACLCRQPRHHDVRRHGLR